MTMVSARCVWEVTAGIIPGQVMPEHTRRFGLTSQEWDDGKGYELFLKREAEAGAYARFLQEPLRQRTRSQLDPHRLRVVLR